MQPRGRYCSFVATILKVSRENAAAEAAASVEVVEEQLEVNPDTQLDLPGGIQEVAVVDAGGRAEDRSKRTVHVKAQARRSGAAGIGATGSCDGTAGLNAIAGGLNAHDVLLVGDIEEVRQQFESVSVVEGKVLGNPHIGQPRHRLTEIVEAKHVDSVAAAGTID